MDNEIYVCTVCGGAGIKPHHPDADKINAHYGALIYSKTIHDTKAGKYTDRDICVVCKGTGLDARRTK